MAWGPDVVCTCALPIHKLLVVVFSASCTGLVTERICFFVIGQAFRNCQCVCVCYIRSSIRVGLVIIFALRAHHGVTLNGLMMDFMQTSSCYSEITHTH